jgi:heat shock protein 4
LNATPKNIIFVDMGHSKLSVFCSAFTKDKCTILAEAHARNTGCRNIDWSLLNHFSNGFKEKYGCDPMKNEKAKLRMLDGIEKMRKTLSANSDATLNIECLMEDEDLSAYLTRE